MSLYVVYDPARPHVVLFSAPTLPEVAAALAAQPDAARLAVMFSRDGFARELDAGEREVLAAATA